MKIIDRSQRTINVMFTSGEVRDMLFESAAKKVGLSGIKPGDLDSIVHSVNEDGTAEICIRLKLIGAPHK